MDIVVESERKHQADIREAWTVHAAELTKWAYQSLYARDNAYPAWVKEVNDWRCVHTDLTGDVFQNHFHGATTIGTYTLGRDSKCLYVGWDIDHHDGDPGDPKANWRYACILCRRLTRIGANPLLEDSNGSGGYHVWLRFDERISGSVAHSVAIWLVRHCPAGIHAEAFPKQPDLNETRRYGNQMRLPGKHHKRDHWSRFFDGEKWLEGENAVRHLLDWQATDISVFSRRAREFVPVAPSPVPTDTDTQPDQDEATAQARRYLAKVPGTQSGQNAARPRACRLTMFVVHGFALATETAVEVLTEWGQKDDQTDDHGGYYPWSEKDFRDLVRWAEGETYSGIRGDKIRLTGHELDAEIEAEVKRWRAEKRLTATETAPKPSKNGKATAEPVRETVKEQEQQQNLPAWAIGISAADLDAEDIPVEYLVDRLLAAMPTVIGGRFKTLKTLIMVDLMVSMSSGTKFLGKWQCKRVNVGIWSGESGRVALQNGMRRICKARGIKPSDCALDWHFSLPPLYSRKDLDVMEGLIRQKDYKAIFVDPAYLCLLDSNTASKAGNVFVMGAALQPLSEVGQKTGCLVGLVHHFGKWTDSINCSPAELGELSQSGLAEWARQWLLLSRRSPYMYDGKHSLYLTAGGSLGQADQLAVDIDEGDLSDAGLRTKWQVSVKYIVQAQADDKIAKIELKQAQAQETEAERMERVVKFLETKPDGETASEIKEHVGCNDKAWKPILQKLLDSGRIVECQVKRERRNYPGFRLA